MTSVKAWVAGARARAAKARLLGGYAFTWIYTANRNAGEPIHRELYKSVSPRSTRPPNCS